MRSTITARGQTVVPAPIRERFGLGPSTSLEWIVDGDGAIRVVPVDLDPVRAFRGSGAGGGTARLLQERQLDRRKEASAERVAQLLQAARSGESRCLVWSSPVSADKRRQNSIACCQLNCSTGLWSLSGWP
jgi:AbrB family looped-hinge helix DNA binding protein